MRNAAVVMVAAVMGFGACVPGEPSGPGEASLTIENAVVPAMEADGSPWDADGSAPDVYAEVLLNGDEVFSTSHVSSFTPHWAEDAGVVVSNGDTLRVLLWDADDSDGDYIMQCDIPVVVGLDASTGGCGADGATVTVSFH